MEAATQQITKSAGSYATPGALNLWAYFDFWMMAVGTLPPRAAVLNL